MSISYDVGFIRKPKLVELDAFMQSLGFKIEPDRQRGKKYTQIYVLCNESAPREIEFFYEDDAGDYQDFFGAMGKHISAYGSLKTFPPETTPLSLDERLKIIKEKNVKTQHDHYRHLNPGLLKWYEIALALREHYHAIVRSEQTGREINPDGPV